jgi:hypothetical protein
LAEELEAGGYEAVRTRLGLAPGGENGQAKAKVTDLFTDLPFET